MGKRPTSNPSNTELPPGWTALHASTSQGNRYLAVWRAFRDATQFEYACAMTPPVDWLEAEEAVAWVGALREARRGRPDLSEADWQQCVRLLYPTLSEQQRQEPQQLLAAIGALRPLGDVDTVAYVAPVRRRPGRPEWTEALFFRNFHEAKSMAAPSDRLADIAAVFRARNAEIGIELASLRRLLRRFTT